jgi:cobalamin biosynthesis protein CobT
LLADEINNWPPPKPEGEIIIQGRGARVGVNGLNHEIQTFRKALEVFSGLLSKKKVRLVCRGTECYTDGNLIVIPDLSILDRKGMTPEEQKRAAEFLEAIRGFVSHEVGHVVYTDFSEIKKRQFVNRSKMHQIVWNCVEDAFIEKKMKELWAGVAVDLTNKSEWALRKLVEPDRWSKLPPVARILTCFLDIADRGGKYQKSWYFKGLHPLYQKVLEELKPEITACVRAQSTKECYDIAERIIEKLKLVNNAQSSFQQIIQEEANKLKKQAQQENDNDDEDEPSESAVAAESDDGDDGDDEEDSDPAEGGGRDWDDEDDDDDDGDDGDDDEGDAGDDSDGDGDGSDDGSDGDGDDDDEGEGDEGDGDAEGQGGGGGDEEEDDDGDGEDGDGEDDEEGGDGDDGDGSDGVGPSGGDDEDEDGEEYKANLEEGDAGGGAGDPNAKESASPVRPNDLWGFDELEDPNNPNGTSGDQYSIESLIKDEAATQLSQSKYSGDSYRVFSNEWDKVGHIDDLMPLLMPNYLIDEVREKATYDKMSRKADAHIGVMKRKLQSILTTQSKPRHMRNLEDGDLDFTNLYKFALKDTDDSGRVFKRTTYTFNNNEVCVALCVNESGSMQTGSYLRCEVVDPSGAKDMYNRPKRIVTDPKCIKRGACMGHGYLSRMELAREVALIFGETLGALNVPFRVVGHTAEPTAASGMYGVIGSNARSVATINRSELHHYTRLGALILTEYKGWEERWAAVKHKMVRMQPRSNTYDGEALRRVAEDIAARREKRKVIFMVDDGIPEPSDFNTNKHRQYLKDIVKQVQASGIEVICLSMQEQAAKEYYDKCIVINEVAETPLLAATELKRILLSAMKRNGA